MHHDASAGGNFDLTHIFKELTNFIKQSSNPLSETNTLRNEVPIMGFERGEFQCWPQFFYLGTYS